MRQEATIYSYTALFYYQDQEGILQKRVMHNLSHTKTRGAYNFVLAEIKVFKNNIKIIVNIYF